MSFWCTTRLSAVRFKTIFMDNFPWNIINFNTSYIFLQLLYESSEVLRQALDM